MVTANPAARRGAGGLLGHAEYAANLVERWLSPLLLLAMRLWMAEIFFSSGLLKIQDMNAAVFLFTEVHPVPLLPPLLAAWLATSVELVASSLLALGLLARLAALPMLAMTLVIQFVVGAADPAFHVTEHYYWMFLLGFVIAFGPDPLSIDHWLKRRLWPQS